MQGIRRIHFLKNTVCILLVYIVFSFFVNLSVEAGTTYGASESVTSVALELAQFANPGAEDTNLAFEKAIAEAQARAAAAKQEKREIKIVLNLENKKIYKITKPIQVQFVDFLEINGNGATILNTSMKSTFWIKSSNHFTVRNLAVDYDPLPYTQGVVTGLDSTGQVVEIQVDAGYPSSSEFAAKIHQGFFTVMDRLTKAEKVGARHLTPIRAEAMGNGYLKVNLQWSATACGPGQIPVQLGDTVAIRSALATAVRVEDSAYTSFVDFGLYSSPGMGILEQGGVGGMVLERVNMIPGEKPRNATAERLVSTNSDGTHFIAVEKGPTVEECNFFGTSDDAINIHNFYFFVLKKVGDNRYYVSPKWDIGLQRTDTIEAYEKDSFRSLGKAVVVSLTKKKIPELKAEISQLWLGKSATTLPDVVYEIELSNDIPLKAGDSVASWSRIGAGAVIRNCSFYASGRVMVKSPNAVIENNVFSYSPGVAIHAGSDIGYWAESNFIKNLRIRNNLFTHCMVDAASMFDSSSALGTIYLGMTPPLSARGFQDNFENENVVIENNTIKDSYLYGIFVTNANGVTIKNNVVGQTFSRGQAFGAGKLFGVYPDSGIFVGMSKNIKISNNVVARGTVAKRAVAIHESCEKNTVWLENNLFT